MKICIFGAGAIGGHMAVKLANSGADVSVVARGPHLAAIRENGLRLRIDGAEEVARLQATDDPAELGPQDYVIITLKAHSLPPVAEKLQPLIGPDTAIVTGMNGVPYWYFHKLGSQWDGHIVQAVDPGGQINRLLPPEKVIGAVVYVAAEVEAPGVIQHVSGDRFPIGEPDGSKSDRVQRLSEALRTSGIRAPVRAKIRDDIWVKLWGNLSFNPISALTGATLEQICADPATRATARAMMVEAQAIGEALGTRFPIDVEKRIDGAAAVGAHKTSMLQDLEIGRPMEIDALVTAVQELGTLTSLPTPTIDTVLSLVRQRARLAGAYSG